MLNINSPTPSLNDKTGEDDKESVEEIPSTVNFVTKNTFRSQSDAPVTQATVEDLWRRALKQEADFRTRYWAMIAGVVIVSVVAILAVIAPLAAQRDTFKEFETRMSKVEKKTEPGHNPALLSRKAAEVDEEYVSAMHSVQGCLYKEPLSPDSLGPSWTCAARDWEQWEASNGTLVTYLCSKSAVCAVLMTGKCSINQWVYTSIKTGANCDCTRKKPNVLAWSNRRRKQRNDPAVQNGNEKIDLTESENWELEHCDSAPPSNWGCAVSDWTSKANHLGYNPKSKGYLVNYTCRSLTRGCTVTRTLECGENGTWKVVFTSSIVNDCICEDRD